MRERVDFLIEPTGAGAVTITVLATTAEPLSLRITDALAAAELEHQLSTRSGRLERGRMLARQGDYRRALEAFSLALVLRRDDPVVLGELGWTAFLAGDVGLARRATREGLRHQTDASARGALLYNLGRIAESRGRDDEAIAAYRRSLDVRPGSAPVENRLAQVEAARATPTCTAPLCPLTPPVDAMRAYELIEEEGCPLFHQRAACRC